MVEFIPFILAALALLFTPGPTNTLLATASASAGLTRSLRLLAAEIIGYMISINLLRLVIGPLLARSAFIGIALKIGCAAYLAYAAWRLFTTKYASFTDAKVVRFRDVLVTTLLNPKAAVFAFVIIPFINQSWARSLPYLATLAGLILCAGSAWLMLGAMVRTSTSAKLGVNTISRAGGSVLTIFATILAYSAMSGVMALAQPPIVP